jgi:hypothetical protein
MKTEHMYTIMYKMPITLVQFGPQLECRQVLGKVHNIEFHEIELLELFELECKEN